MKTCATCIHRGALEGRSDDMVEFGFSRCAFLPSWRYVSPVRAACENFEAMAVATPQGEIDPYDLSELF